MSRFAYVNRRFVRHAEAAVHIEDRGYQFGDGIYEVWAVADGRLNDAAGHFDRLERSLGELRITAPMARGPLEIILRETVRRNRLVDGLLYLQVTRGVARRDHPFPDPTPAPSIVITAKSVDRGQGESKAANGVAVITVPESRWARCDIKTVNLLPNVLAKQAAKEAGAYEAWFIDDLGFVTEGSSTNAWIVDGDGVLRTRDIQANILRGVTRASLLHVAAELGLRIEQAPFSVDDVKAAQEAFITGASTLVTPVVRLNGRPVGDGEPGPVAKRLRELYIAEARRGAL
jgi:D-alanine transaminase